MKDRSEADPGAEEPTAGERRATANPGFALDRLAKAFRSSREDPDPEVRERAATKVGQWLSTLTGMFSGRLKIGSRRPVQGVPEWATPEVVHGGFVTGHLLAGGSLGVHERALLAAIHCEDKGRARSRINAHYLTEEGLQELQRMLEAGTYRIEVPEEGLLLVVAWLIGRGALAEAERLLTTVSPMSDRLRFYPVPAKDPPDESDGVHVATVSDVRAKLDKVSLPPSLTRERETLTVWLPLYDRLIALFSETVEGAPPQRESDGRVSGGWPCRQYPPTWKQRAKDTLEDLQGALEQHRLSRRPRRESRYFPWLHRYLTTCADDPARLTGKDVGHIRGILADVAAKRGLPDSPRCRALRAAQRAQASRPSHLDLAGVLRSRLERFPGDRALAMAQLGAVLGCVSQAEAATLGLPVGWPIPKALARKALVALHAPVEELVTRGVLPSAESLARVVPVVAARVRSVAYRDPALGRLYRALYVAFRRRRSLLLLNLEHQVRFEELPWICALLPYREPGASETESARSALTRLVELSLVSFPQTIIPNRLLQEIRSLAVESQLHLPLTDELAADIFMGAFTGKFVDAAHAAGRLLRGSLYEAYYDIDYERVLAMPLPVSRGRAPAASQPFLEYCTQRADLPTSDKGSVARNGAIIEQQQILTTQNLAVLFAGLGLQERLGDRMVGLADRCYSWLLRRLQVRVPEWKQRLRVIKNAAYAWRQMVFFLSFRPKETQRLFLRGAREQHAALRAAICDLTPALDGLELAIEGRVEMGGEARRFLGWAVGRHWLMPKGEKDPS